MGIFRENELDPNFVPNERQINAIKGLLVGIDEGPFHGSGSGDTRDIDWVWISRNIPAANQRMNELVAAGFVWEHDWCSYDDRGGDYSLGLTGDGVRWAREHLGMPEPAEGVEMEDDPVWLEWIKTLDFKRKVKRGEGNSFKAGVKTTSDWVNQTSYTRDEAEEAIRAIDEAVRMGTILPGSDSAYKAHITRRTVA